MVVWISIHSQVDLTGSGSGTATGAAVIADVYVSLQGRWTTSDSILSTSERKLQEEIIMLITLM